MTCFDDRVAGFKAYEDRGILEGYLGSKAAKCIVQLHNDTWNASDVNSLLMNFKAAVLDDFAPGGWRIGPLPDLLYPCSARTLIRAPWRQVAFDCFTSTAAVLTPLYTAIIWLLQYTREPGQFSERLFSGVADKNRNEDAELNDSQAGQMVPLLPRHALGPQGAISP